MSFRTALVRCPTCGRDDVELPILDRVATGICPGCYAVLKLPVKRCDRCDGLVSADYMSLDHPELCLWCAGGD